MTVFLMLLALPVWLATGYLFLLTILSGTPAVPPRPAPRLRFVVVVPAHDESAGIGRTVASLLALEWPSELRRICVVADNCSDDTATRAREAGAEVIERNDPERRGKGYALDLAFTNLLHEGSCDAMVVVDADTAVAPGLLAAFAARLEEGAQALQAFYGVLNPDAGWRTRLITIALAIFHRLRGRGREALGLSCGLRGNGMCFTADTLRQVPHRAFSIVEDLEYGLQLGRAGIRVEFVDDTHVLGEMVSSEQSARSQRQRWEGGRAQILKRYGWPMLGEGIRRRSRLLLDLALDVIIPPLSTVALCSLGLALLGTVLAMLDQVGTVAAVVGWGPMTMLMIHVARGVQLSGLGKRGWVTLATAPGYVLWKLSLKLRNRADPHTWVRTDREPTQRKTPPQ